MTTTTQSPSPYSHIIAGEIITFGSRTTEWVVLDHPATGNGTIMVKCIKTQYACNLDSVRLLDEMDTLVYLVDTRG